TGAAGDFVETPVRIMDGVQAVSCGNGYTLILKYDGTLWGCGRTSCLGLGTNENAAVPVKLMDNVAAIQAHSDCAGALKKDGSL
ncbi:MAG: chromosome condensation regulator, partial [Firmicutes bacterium]|nr:chromosome condensation regulator [Bacillota bacterium]